MLSQFVFKTCVARCGMANFYWLNGYDTDNSGTFTWIDSQTPASYTNWSSAEPNDYLGTGSEKCIASGTGYFEGWHDMPCSWTFPVVCERDL